MYLKINWSVKTPWHRLSMGVVRFGLWAPVESGYKSYLVAGILCKAFFWGDLPFITINSAEIALITIDGGYSLLCRCSLGFVSNPSQQITGGKVVWRGKRIFSYILYIEDITWWREDMNLIFEWQNNILQTSAASE